MANNTTQLTLSNSTCVVLTLIISLHLLYYSVHANPITPSSYFDTNPKHLIHLLPNATYTSTLSSFSTYPETTHTQSQHSQATHTQFHKPQGTHTESQQPQATHTQFQHPQATHTHFQHPQATHTHSAHTHSTHPHSSHTQSPDEEGSISRSLQSEDALPSTGGRDNPSTDDNILKYLLFFLFVFLSAAILQWLISKVPTYSIPVSIIWFLYGMISYAVCKSLPENSSYLQNAIIEVRQIDSSVVYYVMLPILLYEATQGINWFKFMRFIIGGLSLAVLGVFLQVAFLGVLFYLTFMKHLSESQWEASFLTAACLASTDPVAVLSVLNNVGAPEKLTTMIDGESLINDGSSVLLFQFFFYLTSGYLNSTSATTIMLIKLLFLGPLFGLLLGLIMYSWIIFFRKHHLIQCMATVTICYLGYFISEVYLGFSGPLTAVCYGLFVNAYGRIALDREAQEKHLNFVEGLGLLANCSLFIVSGIVAYGMMSSMFSADYLANWGYCLLSYLYLHVARFLMILVFSPVIKKIGYGINWKEFILLHWGGLRGGISLALALRIERDPNIPEDISTEAAFYISTNVLLILILQGTTFEAVYRFLNPYPPKPFRKVYLEKVMKFIDHQYTQEIRSLESHWLFRGTDVLNFADKVVPRFGWRMLDRLGNLTIKAPDIGCVLEESDQCSLEDWHILSTYYESSAALNGFDKSLKHSMESRGPYPRSSSARSNILDKKLSLELTKYAHRLAAVGQGLKSIENGHIEEGPFFNPKFNLRLVERATYDDNPNPVGSFPLDDENGQASEPQILKRPIKYKSGSEDGLNDEDDDDDTHLRVTSRFDTDATIILPQFTAKDSKTTLRSTSRNMSNSKGSKMAPETDDQNFDDNHGLVKFFFNLFSNPSKNGQRQSPSPLDSVNLKATNDTEMKNDIPFADPPNFSHDLMAYSSHGSNESYMDSPKEPFFIGRSKLLRKEREGELYLMVFNSCQDLYTKLYKSHIIGGNSYLSLDRVLSTSTEFAVEKVRQNPIYEWEKALKECQKGEQLQSEDSTVRQSMNCSTGFEFEWLLLKNRLHSNHLSFTTKLPSKFLRSILLFPACVEDLEQLLAYVDIHEELLENGGQNMERLFGKYLLNNYKTQIEFAKLHTINLREVYSENFKLAIIRLAAVLLINLKSELVKAHATKGLLLEEDKIQLLEILQEQQLKLTNYRQFFSFLKLSTLVHAFVTSIANKFKKRTISSTHL